MNLNELKGHLIIKISEDYGECESVIRMITKKDGKKYDVVIESTELGICCLSISERKVLF